MAGYLGDSDARHWHVQLVSLAFSKSYSVRNIVNFDKHCNIKRPKFPAIITIGAVVVPKKSGVGSLTMEGTPSTIVELKRAMYLICAKRDTTPTSKVMVNIKRNTGQLY